MEAKSSFYLVNDEVAPIKLADYRSRVDLIRLLTSSQDSKLIAISEIIEMKRETQASQVSALWKVRRSDQARKKFSNLSLPTSLENMQIHQT